MDAVELIKKVRKIEIKMRGMTNNVLTGGYHSAFKGRGMTFDEVRAYQPGDDVRTIDWNVTARTGEPFIKKYEEERELTVMLVVDVSGSMFGDGNNLSKHQLIAEIAAVIALSAIRNHDRVGLLLFAEQPLMYLPPRTGSQHLLRLIREILNVESQPRKTNLSAAMTHVFNLHKQRSICFVLSDFIDTGFETALKVLTGRHDVIGMQFTTELEQHIPEAGLLRIKDAETGQMIWLDTSDSDALYAYRKTQESAQVSTQSVFERIGADFVHIRTDEPYFPLLLQLFKKHAKRK